MGIEVFLELFIKELEVNHDLRRYYRFLNSKSMFLWRKAYFEQRLKYVRNHLGVASGNIWDAGCGYGTTSIFLALNGYQVLGNTLEFYYDKIERRLDYWSKFGDLDKLKFEYSNLYDRPVTPEQFDAIIAQDTLHHLEPIREAFAIFRLSLKQEGRLIVTEENGNCIFIMLKNFSKRGFNRVTEYYDENLKKYIPFGNENARSMHSWNKMLHKEGLTLLENEQDYIRFFPPFCVTTSRYRNLETKENQLAKNFIILREILFFGINFTATKTY